jgi:hypothetical protein
MYASMFVGWLADSNFDIIYTAFPSSTLISCINLICEIKDVPMRHMFTFYYEDERIRCWGDAWDIVYDGPLKLQPEEVDSVHMMSMDEIIEGFEEGTQNFTPDSVFACKKYLETFPEGALKVKGPRPDAELL